jgi:hypothetical protein
MPSRKPANWAYRNKRPFLRAWRKKKPEKSLWFFFPSLGGPRARVFGRPAPPHPAPPRRRARESCPRAFLQKALRREASGRRPAIRESRARAGPPAARNHGSKNPQVEKTLRRFSPCGQTSRPAKTEIRFML